MRNYQLDECINSKRFAAKCKSERQSNPFRFPREYSGVGLTDPDVINYCANKNLPILTIDRRILTDHVNLFPPLHPGVIIVALGKAARKKVKSITWIDVAKILARVKESIPQWPNLTLRNSIVEVTTEGIEIWHIEERRVRHDGFYSRRGAKWKKEVLETLLQNSSLGGDGKL